MQKKLDFDMRDAASHEHNRDEIPFSDEIPPYLDQEYDDFPSAQSSHQSEDVPAFVRGIEFDAAEVAEQSAQRVITHLSDPSLTDARVDHAKSQADFFAAKGQLIKGPETRRTQADAELTTARRDFVKGPEWQRTLAQASSFRGQAQHAHAQAKFVSGVETDRARAETNLAHARSTFVAGPDTRRAQSQAEEAGAAAMMNWAKAEFTQGAETQRTLAEAKKIDMDRYINLAMIIGKGVILLTLVVVFTKYFR